MTENLTQNNKSKKEIFPLEENVNVVLRLKPSICDSESYIENNSQKYDIIYNENILNRKIYDNTVLPIIKSFMKGIDVNFLAFGPKNGGKTYTFIGEKFNINAFKKDSKGIILYAITSIFKALNFMKEKNIKYQIGYSLVEIPDNGKNVKISLNESFKGFNNLKDVKQAILRHYKENKYEDSHTIFNVTLVQYRINKKNNLMMKLESKLNFIDFSHTVTDNLLDKMDYNPFIEPKENLHSILSYCQCLDEIVNKALSGKDRTVIFYCTPFLNKNPDDIEAMGKMENIIQLLRQISCTLDINCSESSNSNMVRENLAFLKKKLNRFKQTISVKEDERYYYQGSNESSESISPSSKQNQKIIKKINNEDLGIYDDSKEDIEPDTDDSEIIVDYNHEHDNEGLKTIIEDDDFNDEIIIKNVNILISNSNPFLLNNINENNTTKSSQIQESTPYFIIPERTSNE